MKPASDAGPADLVERLVLGVAGTVALVTVTFLGLSRLAASLFGSGTLQGDVTTALDALSRLPSHLGDPAAAWMPPNRAVLPGPVLYHLVLDLPVVLAVGAAFATRRALRVRRDRSRPLGVEPNIGVAERLRPLEVRKPTAGRVTLGRVGGRLVAAEAGASLAVVGPSGCGKTAGFAIPALLEWDGPVIATSVKTDLVAHTLDARRQRGKVWVYDPTGCAGIPTDRWSPLSECGKWGGAQRMSRWLVKAAEPKRGVSDFWVQQAQKTLAPLLHAAAVSGRIMADVVRWVDTEEIEDVRAALVGATGMPTAVEAALIGDDARRLRSELGPTARARAVDEVRRRHVAEGGRDTRKYLRDPAEWPAPARAELDEATEEHLDGAVRAELEVLVLRRGGRGFAPLVAAEASWAKEEKLRSSVYTTMQNILLGYADPVVEEASAGSDIDFDEWLSGPNTIHVVAPPHDQDDLRPVLIVLLQSAVRRAYETANRHGGCLPNRCLVLLDEAGNIAPLPDLPAYATTGRSHGISLVTVWQDLAQMDALYGTLSQVVLSNHRARIFGTGIGHPATLDTVSKLVGDLPVREHNVSRGPAGGRSVSEHTAYRRAAPIDLLRRMDPTTALLVYGSEPPARLELRPFYRRDRRAVPSTGVGPPVPTSR